MLSEDQVAEFRAKHGRVKYVVYNGIDLVFRKPSRMECIAHASAQQDPQQKNTADEAFAAALVVHPSREAFAALLEEYGYMCSSATIATAIAKLSGILQDEEAKSAGNASRGSGNSLTTSPVA